MDVQKYSQEKYEEEIKEMYQGMQDKDKQFATLCQDQTKAKATLAGTRRSTPTGPPQFKTTKPQNPVKKHFCLTIWVKYSFFVAQQQKLKLVLSCLEKGGSVDLNELQTILTESAPTNGASNICYGNPVLWISDKPVRIVDSRNI